MPISYYNEYIQRNPDWVFAGIYADEAYSGTKDDRPRFVQLIQDCKNGKIDRIITKSISRFARNTVTLLTTVRDLRRMGIGIYFEEQNIDTLTEAGELMITLLASQAQEESRATSENCKWRIRKKFEEGYTTHFNLVGYHQVDGLVEMIPEEAELVKRIFQLYLEGYGQQAIANILFEENAPTCMGGEWFSTTIRSMLRNEKYIMRRAIEYRRNHPDNFRVSAYEPPTTYNDNSKEHRNVVFADTLEVIENIILFSISNYFLRFSNEYKRVHNVSEFSNNWYEYVEFGTTNPLTILLQRNGFSREAATYIRGHQEYVSADKSSGQLRLNRSLLQCGNTSVEMEAADIILNVPELFV